MNKKAVLLINLGTPDHHDARSVRLYLKEFLNDARVIDLPALIRWPLVNGLIIPLRYQKTRAAYEKIWTSSGSPLLGISQQIKQALAVELGPDYQVELGMRYGNPSLSSAIGRLGKCSDLTIIPLYPQYSSAATGSALEMSLTLLAKQWNIPTVHSVSDFYNHPGFVHAFSEQIKHSLSGKQIDKLIFSYHGLPERHLEKSHCLAQCDHVAACPVISEANRFCYRAQCYATTQLIANELGLSAQQYIVSFQSRLGRTPWIKPYTDLVLPDLVKEGVRNIAIVSPSFVADCLETLEEIGIRTKEQWQALGGSEFTFIPCVNDAELCIQALASMVRE